MKEMTPERALAWAVLDALTAARIDLERSPARVAVDVIEAVVRNRWQVKAYGDGEIAKEQI